MKVMFAVALAAATLTAAQAKEGSGSADAGRPAFCVSVTARYPSFLHRGSKELAADFPGYEWLYCEPNSIGKFRRMGFNCVNFFSVPASFLALMSDAPQCADPADEFNRMMRAGNAEGWLEALVPAWQRELEDGRLVKDAVGQLPILVKLLDSDERLVIQAHPTVPCAKRLFNSPAGKTECWYFLPGTAPDACVYLGFKPGVTREEWERAVWKNVELWNCGNMELWKYENVDGTTRSTCSTRLKNPLLEMLHRVPVAPGDFVFVDGGVPHAIGAGCFMVELQEPSDLMVVAERFTPSGRRIPDAKLHGGVGWEKMFDVYEYEGRTYEETCAKYVRRSPAGAGSVQICGPDFTDKFEMWRVAGGCALELGGAKAVAVVTDGEGSLNGRTVKRGDRLVACGEESLCVGGSAAAVVSLRREIP